MSPPTTLKSATHGRLMRCLDDLARPFVFDTGTVGRIVFTNAKSLTAAAPPIVIR